MHGTASYGGTAACCQAVGEVRELKYEPKTMLPENQQSGRKTSSTLGRTKAKLGGSTKENERCPRREHGMGGWELQLAVGKPPSHPAVITSYFVLVILLG